MCSGLQHEQIAVDWDLRDVGLLDSVDISNGMSYGT